jgi:hypothetical protein
MPYANTRKQAHDLIDRMAPSQVSALVGVMEVMLDPFARALANAPYDDEPVSDEDARAIADSRSALTRSETICHDEVLAEFGMSATDFERVGSAPVESNQSGH